jgi:hypothetical protein
METNKSLFPAYNKNSDKSVDNKNELQYNWLSLNSYDNQKIDQFRHKFDEQLKLEKSVESIPQKNKNEDKKSSNY